MVILIHKIVNFMTLFLSLPIIAVVNFQEKKNMANAIMYWEREKKKIPSHTYVDPFYFSIIVTISQFQSFNLNYTKTVSVYLGIPHNFNLITRYAAHFTDAGRKKKSEQISFFLYECFDTTNY